MADEKAPIDERLQAISVNLELLSANMHAMQEEHRKLDARERRARKAILTGIEAYFRELDQEEVDDNGEA